MARLTVIGNSLSACTDAGSSWPLRVPDLVPWPALGIGCEGVPGATTRSWVEAPPVPPFIPASWDEAVAAEVPDYLAIWLGTNDAFVGVLDPEHPITAQEFQAHLRSLVDEAAGLGMEPAHVLLLTTPPRVGFSRETLAYRDATLALCDETPATCVDVGALVKNAHRLEDRIHLNELGAQLVAEQVALAIPEPSSALLVLMGLVAGTTKRLRTLLSRGGSRAGRTTRRKSDPPSEPAGARGSGC